MPKELSIDGFRIRIGRGSLRIIKKAHSIYDGKTMVVIPLSIFNTHTTTKKLSREHYDNIIKGSVVKARLKADHGFFDSPLNLLVKPNKEATGYIRVPFSGNGKYGIRLNYSRKNKRTIAWYFETSPTTKPLPFNKEFMPFPKSAFTFERTKPKTHSNKTTTHPKASQKPKKKRRKLDEPFYHPDNLDMLDYYCMQESSRKADFSHGRKRRMEWNNITARSLKDELDELRKKQQNDPNTFDRGAMK